MQPTDTACLATHNAPANRPDPMQKLNRVPKREPCGDKLLTSSSDATFMLPAPSDHHMREATTALLSVSATLGPQLLMVVEVLRALSGLVRRNA